MKKRDRPLVGDSPARIRVPMVGTVSLGGVVAVANGRCGIPESSPGRPLRKAVCGASPRNQVRGRLRRASGHRSCPRSESGRRPVQRVWDLGKRDGSPQGSGRGRQRPPCGCCLVERSARASNRKKATTLGPSRALKRPVASRVVNRCLRYDSTGPLSGQGRGQAFARGRRPRRLRPETSLPGRQRIPRTAATSSVPPSSVGTRAAALPVPWL